MPTAKRLPPVPAPTSFRIPACVLTGILLAGCESVVPHRIEPATRTANGVAAHPAAPAPAPPSPSPAPAPATSAPSPASAGAPLVPLPPSASKITTTAPAVVIGAPPAVAAPPSPPPAPPKPAPAPVSTPARPAVEPAATNPILATADVAPPQPPAGIASPKTPAAEARPSAPAPGPVPVTPPPVAAAAPPAPVASIAPPKPAPAPIPTAIPAPVPPNPVPAAAAPSQPATDPYAAKLAMLSSNGDVMATRVRSATTPPAAPPPVEAAKSATPPPAPAPPPPATAPPPAPIVAPPAPPPAEAAAATNIDPKAKALLDAMMAEQKAAAEPAAPQAPAAAATTAPAGAPFKNVAKVATAPAAPAPAPAPASDATPGAGADLLTNMPLPNLPTLPRPQQADPAAKTQLARADAPAAAPEAGNEPATASLENVNDPRQLAQAELQDAQNRLNLSDAQVDKLQRAQKLLAAGDNNGALALLQPLEQELQNETRSYVVQGGESLWHVAGQDEVYGNSYLWPLIWEANKARVKQPYQLYKGLRLTFPAHPTAQQVADALAYAKKNGSEGMKPASDQ